MCKISAAKYVPAFLYLQNKSEYVFSSVDVSQAANKVVMSMYPGLHLNPFCECKTASVI